MALLDFIIGQLPKQTFVIASGVTVDGSFACNGSGIIIGRIDGDISIDGKITVTKEGVINGNVKTVELVVKGSITGNIYCEGKIILSAGAYIQGNILAGEIEIEKNAIIDGIVDKLADKNSIDIKDFINGLTKPTNLVVVPNTEIAIKSTPPPEDIPVEKASETWF